MGSTSNSTMDFGSAVQQLNKAGQVYQRSAQAAASGNISGSIADILNPRKLNRALFPRGVREACFEAGKEDEGLTPIIISLDLTGSMNQVPFVMQKEIPHLLTTLQEQGLTQRPNLLFMGHDDEHVSATPDAAFQISQFEIGDQRLAEALNEMVIPSNGAGNDGEAYHLAFYATANHVRTDSFDKQGQKGFFFMICDEYPFYYDGDFRTNGTKPNLAKDLFGDTIEKEVSILDSLKEVVKQWHVFILRPGHTSHGSNNKITKRWQELLREAGENPENVLEIPETEALVSTMALTIGKLGGVDEEEMVDALSKKGAAGVNTARSATRALVPVQDAALATVGSATGSLVGSGEAGSGRQRTK